MSVKSWKKAYAFVTFTNSTEKIVEIWNVKESRIRINKFKGEKLFDQACDYLLEMKKKRLEGIFFDLFEHRDSEFLVNLRKEFLGFCDLYGLLCRWIFRDVLFSTMLLYFSDENFKTEDTVIIGWIKNDDFVFHKHKNGYLTQLDRIKINDERFEKKFDKIVEANAPKLVVMDSTTVSNDIKKMLLSKSVKMMKNKFYEYFEKSVANLFQSLLRGTPKCRWNFKVQHFNAFKIQVRSDSGNLILQSTDDSLPSKTTIELPKLFSSIKGTTKFSFGCHFSYQKASKKITVEVAEDGFLECFLPEKYCSTNFSVFEVNGNNEYVFYKNVKEMEDFIYITTTKFNEKVLQVWKVLGESCCKTEFYGETMLKDLKEYLSKFRSTAFDAIVFNLYEHADMNFLWNARKELSGFCDAQKIRYEFITEENLFISMLLQKSEKKLLFDCKKLVVLGYLLPEKKQFCLFKINVLRTKFDVIERFQYKRRAAITKDFKGCEPECFIISANEQTAAFMKENFDNVYHLEDTFEQCFTSVSSEIFLHIFTTKNSKWHFVSPPSPAFKLKAETCNEIIGFFENGEIRKYPCVKTLMLPPNTVRLYVASENKTGYFIEYSESNKGTFTVDISADGFTHFCFPSKFAAFDGGSKIYKEFAKKLNAIVLNRKPVILFTEDIAILFVYENGTYSSIEIDGRKELRAVINFAEDEPVIGQKAAEKRFNNPFVVYDILEAMKIDPMNYEKKNYWKFDIVGHDEFPVLYQFQTSDGITHAPPSSLLAIIIKRLAKEYKKKTGHKLKDVMVPDVFENETVMEEVKKAFYQTNVKCTVINLKL